MLYECHLNLVVIDAAIHNYQTSSGNFNLDVLPNFCCSFFNFIMCMLVFDVRHGVCLR